MAGRGCGRNVRTLLAKLFMDLVQCGNKMKAGYNIVQSISREDAIKIISEIRNVVGKEIDLKKYLEEQFIENTMEQTELETDIQGTSNGFLSEILSTVTGYKFEVYGEVEKLFACPCCGLRTLTEVYNLDEGTGYDICPYCKWEDDGTTDKNIYRSINGGSIEDYHTRMRENFNRYYINKWFAGEADSIELS